MKIEILCSSPKHPINTWLEKWVTTLPQTDSAKIVHDKSQISSGELLFLISVTELIDETILSRFTHNAIIHSSDLPDGRGWSPQVWAILAGATEIVVSGIEAAEKFDTGPIWTKRTVTIPPHFIFDEISSALFDCWCDVMTVVYEMVKSGAVPEDQEEKVGSYCRRRSPSDSALDPNETIAKQFNLLRISDPARYPAHFELFGHKYVLRLEKYHESE